MIIIPYGFKVLMVMKAVLDIPFNVIFSVILVFLRTAGISRHTLEILWVWFQNTAIKQIVQ